LRLLLDGSVRFSNRHGADCGENSLNFFFGDLGFCNCFVVGLFCFLCYGLNFIDLKAFGLRGIVLLHAGDLFEHSLFRVKSLNSF
jgi:hypothetical protein